MRFVAFLGVFVAHTLPRVPNPHSLDILKSFAPVFYVAISAGRFGVSLFFVLSAFLICELLMREKQVTGAVNCGQFYVRRILRIWPLYYFALALGAVSAVLLDGNRGGAAHIGWFAIFMGGWYFVHGGTVPDLVFPLWSISLEEQFYLFVPCVMKLFNRRRIFVFCLLLLLVSNLRLVYLGHIRAGENPAWYSIQVQCQCFAVGILLCLALRGRLPAMGMFPRVILLVASGCGWLIASSLLRYEDGAVSSNPGIFALVCGYLLISAGAVMILISFLGQDSRFIPRSVVYLGRISYGLYVFHVLGIEIAKWIVPRPHPDLPLLFLVRWIAALAFTVALAALSYRFLESPFLRLKERFTIIPSEIVPMHSSSQA